MDIIEFGVNGNLYTSAIIKSEISSSNVQDLEASPNLNLTTDTCFLQILVRGPKCLYYYLTDNGKEQFYILNTTSIDLLVYKKYIKDPFSTATILENKRFIGQLSIYLQDCPSLRTNLNSASYTKNSLERIFLKYYDCTKENLNYNKKTKVIKPEFGFLAGLSETSLIFNSDLYAELVYADYQPSTNVTCGAYVNINLPGSLKDFVICNGLVFTSYAVSGSYTDYYSSNQYTITDTKFDYSYLKLNTMIRYMFPIKHFMGFANAGISNGIALKAYSYSHSYIKFFTSVSEETGTAISDPDPFEQGFYLGLGSRYKKYNLEFRYELGSGMSQYNSLGSTTKRLILMFGYQL